ncbi:helix-turn-helix transcriptional regulator [Leucobacter rhizosphaerae]|uniref:Helix-turn-helix transcriptional regulator n=1 Tax=Leucobacter rhizosphaerae TaxID=2932245 RepID=A0ABY4FWP7_9MICO|nr:helix-turn-helix transcriptional regulator [Leucobacter rhizosphaerae]UOQ60702.1 helix-turn-helix transcriptional regulator [Leucobacter rhizosphaerae]
MSLATFAPQPGRLSDVTSAAVAELHRVLPFDAMQLLRHDPRRAAVGEALRVGYSPGAAWALQHLFVEKYRVGFTETLSPNDGLPPAISSVRSEFRDDFIASPIFRDHLQRQGYRDGISMELFLRGEYVGIAHFSSTRATGFPEESRRAASAVRGLLAALILDAPVARHAATSTATPGILPGTTGDPDARWLVLPDRGTSPGEPPTGPPLVRTERFSAHLAQFRRSGLDVIRHLWLEGPTLYRIDLRTIPGGDEVAVGMSPAHPDHYSRLTVQELRVLTLLCTGLDDATIAQRLHLSRRTVESHVANARRKLGAKNRVEAVVRTMTTASTLPDPIGCPVDALWPDAGSARGGDPR